MEGEKEGRREGGSDKESELQSQRLQQTSQFTHTPYMQVAQYPHIFTQYGCTLHLLPKRLTPNTRLPDILSYSQPSNRYNIIHAFLITCLVKVSLGNIKKLVSIGVRERGKEGRMVGI